MEVEGREKYLKMLMVLKMREGFKNKGMQEIIRSWKKYGIEFFFGVIRRNVVLLIN